MQHSFGDSSNTSLGLVVLDPGKQPRIEEVSISATPKRNMSCESLTEFENIEESLLSRHLRVVFKGSPEEIKVVRLTSKYKDYIQRGVKVVFRSTKSRSSTTQNSSGERLDLRQVLQGLIDDEDPDVSSRMNLTLKKYCPQLVLNQ